MRLPIPNVSSHCGCDCGPTVAGPVSRDAALHLSAMLYPIADGIGPSCYAPVTLARSAAARRHSRKMRRSAQVVRHSLLLCPLQAAELAPYRSYSMLTQRLLCCEVVLQRRNAIQQMLCSRVDAVIEIGLSRSGSSIDLRVLAQEFWHRSCSERRRKSSN